MSLLVLIPLSAAIFCYMGKDEEDDDDDEEGESQIGDDYDYVKMLEQGAGSPTRKAETLVFVGVPVQVV